MARIDKKPTDYQLFNVLSKEHKETIKKMLDIQDILLYNPPMLKNPIV